jgi:hypothetical protein
MLELMVATLCIPGDYGCTEALRAYYSSKPKLQLQVRDAKRDMDRALGPELKLVLPAAGMFFRGKYQIKIKSGLFLQVQESQYILGLSKSF